MAILLKVGDSFAAAPSDFPTCYDYEPETSQDDMEAVINKAHLPFPFTQEDVDNQGSSLLAENGQLKGRDNENFCATNYKNSKIKWTRCTASAKAKWSTVAGESGQDFQIKSTTSNLCWSKV